MTFRAWKIDESLFLPPTVGDFVAKDHLARFVLSLVKDELDLVEMAGTYGSERGQPNCRAKLAFPSFRLYFNRTDSR